MSHSSAADWASMQVERVRDDPAARLALLAQTYHGPWGDAPRQLPFRRAALAFMRWQVARGVLASPRSVTPGSPWWRAANERLLRDGCEAVAFSGGRTGTPSSATVELWLDFVANPHARTWYRAHNASIAAAYLENQSLAEQEAARRALLPECGATASPICARTGRGAALALGPWLGSDRYWDPRLAVTGISCPSPHLPDRYPLTREVHLHSEEKQVAGRWITASSSHGCNRSTSGQRRNCARPACLIWCGKATRSTHGQGNSVRSGRLRLRHGLFAPCGISSPSADAAGSFPGQFQAREVRNAAQVGGHRCIGRGGIRNPRFGVCHIAGSVIRKETS